MADDTGTKVAVIASALVALGIVVAAMADSPRLCAPGQQKACTCDDPSAAGVLICAPDGASWSACGQCPPTMPAAPAAAAAAPAAAAADAPAAAAPPAASASCSAKVGAPKVSRGKLSAESVFSEVARAEGALEACCQASAASSKLPSRALVRLAVSREGKVANVQNGGRGPGATLPACALEAFRELDFATACRPEGAKCNATASIDVPLTFDAK